MELRPGITYYPGEFSGDSTQLLFLRARYYNPADGRFQSRDTWSGDYLSPLTLNAWNYTNANPINYTDPSGHCIFTGIDTAACIAALAIGIPIVAGVTTAAWDYAVSQGGGFGGRNWFNPECIDWSQVASAGGSGTVAAFEKLLAIPLGIGYIVNSLMGVSPTQTNAGLLGFFGLDDEYLALQNDPYYIAGGYGGQAGTTYISIALFIKGLPTGFTNQQFPLTSPQSFIGTNGVLVASPGISVSIPIPVGGSAGLLGIGSTGLISSNLSILGNGGTSGQWHHVLSNKIMRALNNHPALKGIFNREDFLVQAATSTDHSGYQNWHRSYDSQVVNWLESTPQATRGEFIKYLHEIYGSTGMRSQFPNALDIIK